MPKSTPRPTNSTAQATEIRLSAPTIINPSAAGTALRHTANSVCAGAALQLSRECARTRLAAELKPPVGVALLPPGTTKRKAPEQPPGAGTPITAPDSPPRTAPTLATYGQDRFPAG